MDRSRRFSDYTRLDVSYNSGNYQTELTELPKSRAPSYVSTVRSSFWSGHEDDRESLIGHARVLSGFNTRTNVNTARRRPTGLAKTSTTNKEKRKHCLAGNHQGWHFGVFFAAGTATTVLCLNVIFTIFVSARYGTSGGVGIAYEGSCEVVNRSTTWLHIAINGLSSLLLSASNYTMQVLQSPTRGEIDAAHARRDWMDIGVPSVRNLFRIKWHRTALSILLALSSIPIHLLYNSAVFKTIDSNIYTVVVANEQWFEGGNLSTNFQWDGGTRYGDSGSLHHIQNIFAQNRSNETAFRNLTNTECIDVYSAPFVSSFSHVVLITNETDINSTLFYAEATGGGSRGPENSWMCIDYWKLHPYSSSTCDTTIIKAHPETWTINRQKIDHCIAQLLPQHCTLQFSLQILVAVIICNALKSICMFATLCRQKSATLVTIGDAVASFLNCPDDKTKGRCLMGKADIRTWKLDDPQARPNALPPPRTYFARRSHWFSTASKTRWSLTVLLMIGTIITSGVLLSVGFTEVRSGGASPFSLGFGAINGRSIINVGLPSTGGSGLVSAVLLANSPQAIVSFLYMLYNSLLTCLMLAREWSTYSRQHKPLRVTTPHGVQRSTYYLQLPFRYAAPLLVVSATLHWVISQSIFFARIDAYKDGMPSTFLDFSGKRVSGVSLVGYSCLPILIAILIGFVLLVFALVMGFRRHHGQMPVVSSCSVAIGAACHPPEGDTDAAYLPVQWGEVKDSPDIESDETGHCSFTSFAVNDLTSGRMYGASVRTSA